MPSWVSFRSLDFDDLDTEIRENHGSIRANNNPGKVQKFCILDDFHNIEIRLFDFLIEI